MTTVGEIYRAIDSFAPYETAEGFDNCGLLIGSMDAPVTKALTVLDADCDALKLAQSVGAELILSHHPVIFTPLRKIPANSVVYRLIRSGISVISSHTNVDKAPHGLGALLTERLGVTSCVPVEGTGGCTVIGDTPSGVTSGTALADHVKAALKLPAVRVFDAGNEIRRVAVCCGSGGGFFEAVVASEADAFVTGDIKHDPAVSAKNLGLTLIDAGHYETEWMFAELMAEYLKPLFPEVAFITPESYPPILQLRK